MMIRQFFIHSNRKATSCSNYDNNISKSSTVSSTGTIVNSRCFTESSTSSSDSDSTEPKDNNNNDNNNSSNTIVSSLVAEQEEPLVAVCTGYFSTFCDYCGNNKNNNNNNSNTVQKNICMYQCFICKLYYYCSMECYHNDITHNNTGCDATAWVTRTMVTSAAAAVAVLTPTPPTTTSLLLSNSNNNNSNYHLPLLSDNDNQMEKELEKEEHQEIDTANAIETIIVNDQHDTDIVNENMQLFVDLTNPEIIDIPSSDNEQKVLIDNSSYDTIKQDNIINEEEYGMIEKSENEEREGEIQVADVKTEEAPDVDENYAADVDISMVIQQLGSNEGIATITLQETEEPQQQQQQQQQQELGFEKNNLQVNKQHQQKQESLLVYTDDRVNVSIAESDGNNKKEHTSRTMTDNMIDVSTISPTNHQNDVVIIDKEKDENCSNSRNETTTSKSIVTKEDYDNEKETTGASSTTKERLEQENKADSDNSENKSTDVEVDTTNDTLEKEEEVDEQDAVIGNGAYDSKDDAVATLLNALLNNTDSVTETIIEQNDNNDNSDDDDCEVEQTRMMIQPALVDEIVEDDKIKIDDIYGGSNEDMSCDINELEHVDCLSTIHHISLHSIDTNKSSSSSSSNNNNDTSNTSEAIQSKPSTDYLESEVDTLSGESHVVVERIHQAETNEFSDKDDPSSIEVSECSIFENTTHTVTEQSVSPVPKSNNRTTLSIATSGDTLDNIILRKCQYSSNSMSKDNEWDTPEWVHQARTHSASVLSSLSTLSPRSKAIPKRTVSLQLDDLTLRQGIVQEQKVYDWEKPEWVDENNLNRSYDAIEEIERRLEENKQNGLSSLNNSSIIEIEQLELRHTTTIEKKEYEWEKPVWATKTKLRSSNNRSTNIPITKTTTNTFIKSISDTERSKVSEWQTNTEKSNISITTKKESKIGEQKDDKNTSIVKLANIDKKQRI